MYDENPIESRETLKYNFESKLWFQTDWKNGWNVTTARLACETALQTSAVYEQCNSLDAVDNDISIESCVRDIQVLISISGFI